ncbi:MAG: NTP transferase domain-containing protein [Planctomycetaceae bacterium]|nr:NTP transferase domain-containing protein [Planctomycetaceae bacterium]
MAGTLAIVLAAGKSRRMQSDTPKVLHEVCGRPMVEYVLDAAREAGAKKIVVVVGHKAEVVQDALSHHPDVAFALQEQQNGTGHAVMCCKEAVGDHDGTVLVLTGDTPLLRGSSLKSLIDEMQSASASCVVGTANTEQNQGLGRIVRGESGEFLRIVEQKDATPEEQSITEINTGCFAYDCKALFEALEQVRPNNNQGEYYLTDCAEILRNSGHTVVAACKLDIAEAMGVNTQEQLAEVAQVMKSRG